MLTHIHPDLTTMLITAGDESLIYHAVFVRVILHVL